MPERAAITAPVHNLEVMAPLREQVLREAFAALSLPTASRGLDVGCGLGDGAMLLADATGPLGHVVGLDRSPDLLAEARARVAARGLEGRVSLAPGDMMSLPFDRDGFDWSVSVDCVGYPAGDLLTPLSEMARVVRPGGTVALLGWTSQRLLPGHPLLEARLDAGWSAYAPFYRDKAPDTHFTRGAARLAEAGIGEPAARTFVGQARAPLNSELRAALGALLQMCWAPDPASEEGREHARLSTPSSPDFILDVPGYLAFFTYTMISGVVM